MSRQESKNSFLKKQREERRLWAKVLLGGRCIECGSFDNLEFDHIEPKTKKFSIGKMWSTKLEVLQEELKKCRLVCKTCHLVKSSKESRRRMLGTAKHGSMQRYYKWKCRCELCRTYKHSEYLKQKERDKFKQAVIA